MKCQRCPKQATLHITEVLGYDAQQGQYQMQDIFVREYQGFDDKGMIISQIVPTGIIPRCQPQLQEHGVDLPACVYEAARNGDRRPASHY